MNSLKQLAAALIALIATGLAAQAQQERFEIELRGAYWTTNDAGNMVRQIVTHNTYKRECIVDLGITNRIRTMLVYHAGADFNGDIIEVVQRGNDQVLCQKLRLLFPTTLANNSGSEVRKLVRVFTVGGNDHVGEGLVTRKVTRNGRVLLGGDITFELPADGTNGVRLCRVRFNSVRQLPATD
ncbi:MAG TPA: hypothetical protein VEH04_08845 [Verrucomicrobiae bacterium]|nr:hypothetical protein [Verrucomicrobiae bacterium]